MQSFWRKGLQCYFIWSRQSRLSFEEDSSPPSPHLRLSIQWFREFESLLLRFYWAVFLFIAFKSKGMFCYTSTIIGFRLSLKKIHLSFNWLSGWTMDFPPSLTGLFVRRSRMCFIKPFAEYRQVQEEYNVS